jgi:hypothetical protein
VNGNNTAIVVITIVVLLLIQLDNSGRLSKAMAIITGGTATNGQSTNVGSSSNSGGSVGVVAPQF